jgi:tRNA G18 (ribose-2'-O)-methylase SpoU
MRPGDNGRPHSASADGSPWWPTLPIASAKPPPAAPGGLRAPGCAPPRVGGPGGRAPSGAGRHQRAEQPFQGAEEAAFRPRHQKGRSALLAGARPVQTNCWRPCPNSCLAWITSGDSTRRRKRTAGHLEWLQLADPLFQTLDIFGTRGPAAVDRNARPWPHGLPTKVSQPGCSLLVPFQDPENIGTVIRSAAAFGVTQVILLAESAHPFHPKALRASGGTPCCGCGCDRGRPWRTCRPICRWWPSPPMAGISPRPFSPAFGLLAGMEGEGLYPPHGASRRSVSPCDPSVESLNAATATAVALYEWRRRMGGSE